MTTASDLGMAPLALLPEILLVTGALVVLVLGSFLARHRQWAARLVALAALLAAGLVACATVFVGAPVTVFSGAVTVDGATAAARVVIAVATGLVIGLGADEIAGDARESESYTLLLLAASGASVLAGASDLLVLAVGFLLTGIPTYALIGLARTRPAAEAALKTYLLGALSGVGLLLGATVLFGLTAATSYAEVGQRLGTAPLSALALGAVAVLAGLLFEAGAVPVHFWVPDAAQGSRIIAAAFVTTVPKVGALVATYRFVAELPGTIAVELLVGALAVAGMTLGNLTALGQDDPRRLLGWSTVSQVGYLLVPVAVVGGAELALPALLYYLAAYSVTNLAAFAVVAAVPAHRLDDHRGLATSRPWLAAALLVSMLGLLGTPPTAVFVGKLTAATAAWQGGAPWLTVALLVNTVASLAYYLRWIAVACRPAGPAEHPPHERAQPRPSAAAVAVLAASVSVALGVASGVA